MIIDGKQIAAEIYRELSAQADSQDVLHGKRVAFISFAHDPRSAAFISVKEKAAAALGIVTTVIETDVATTDAACALVIEAAEKVDGIVIQLPIPKHLDAQKIIAAIPVEKDIDVLGDTAIAQFKHKIKNKAYDRIPPVAAAVWEVLLRTYADTAGDVTAAVQNKNIVILGKGKLVGEPVAALFDREGIAYQAFSRDSDVAAMHAAIKNASVIITGLGKPHFLMPDMLREGVVLIDAGTSEQAGKLVGDCDPSCAEKASVFTPVPGGIGPITVACLYRNLFH